MEAVPIPIGAACGGEELLVVDEQRRVLPVGEIGEICIAGAGLSPGYWRDDNKTTAAFVPDPRPGREGAPIYRTGDLGRVREDGLFEFLGRVDSQIKSRGHRIELGEVEAALNAIERVRECAAVRIDAGGFEGTAICCAYAPVPGVTLERRWLRRELAKAVPPYMLPIRWAAMEALPKNLNGKIDRPSIRARFQSQMARRATDLGSEAAQRR